MKLNVDKYPLLWAIQSGRFLDYSHQFANWNEDSGNPEFLKAYMGIDKVWPGMVPRIRENVVFLCDTYIEAINRSSVSFLRALKNDEALIDEFIASAGAGCYLWRDPKGALNGLVYDLAEEYSFIFLCQNCDTLQYVFYRTIDKSNDFEFVTSIEPHPEEKEGNLFHDLALYWMMERYAKTETRILSPKKKMRITPTKLEGILNELRFKVKLRDSSWFTTIIRNEGFTVSGHFRLQPKKDTNGEWTRELIYINEYQKHGYHRNALIIEHRPEGEEGKKYATEK